MLRISNRWCTSHDTRHIQRITADKWRHNAHSTSTHPCAHVLYIYIQCKLQNMVMWCNSNVWALWLPWGINWVHLLKMQVLIKWNRSLSFLVWIRKHNVFCDVTSRHQIANWCHDLSLKKFIRRWCRHRVTCRDAFPRTATPSCARRLAEIRGTHTTDVCMNI